MESNILFNAPPTDTSSPSYLVFFILAYQSWKPGNPLRFHPCSSLPVSVSLRNTSDLSSNIFLICHFLFLTLPISFSCSLANFSQRNYYKIFGTPPFLIFKIITYYNVYEHITCVHTRTSVHDYKNDVIIT